MILVEPSPIPPLAERSIEIVERKGIGHPDTICDAVMDAISVALSQCYLREFGCVLHHNVDKGLLAAGSVALHFGGGHVQRPMELTIGDRATFTVGARHIPVADIAINAAKQWLRAHLRHADPERHVQYRIALAQGSSELVDIFSRAGGVLPANDTSAAIGYYPLTPTEQLVLGLEHHLNSDAFKTDFADTGEDVKIMAMRHRNKLELTVAMPLLAGAIGSEPAYFARKAEIHRALLAYVHTESQFDQIDLAFNALDMPGRGLGGVYLTLLGTSAEHADSGQVGRGNRVNGLIAVTRPLGTEAAAGKNPVSHVGKIYNVLAHRLARSIYEQIEGVREAYVTLLSRIGTPIDQPQLVSAQLRLEGDMEWSEARDLTEAIIAGELRQLASLCTDLAAGRYPIC